MCGHLFIPFNVNFICKNISFTNLLHTCELRASERALKVLMFASKINALCDFGAGALVMRHIAAL